mmetsp:Transcript_8139/g.30145  ORF Transcript_8139/g.30145 Transcript_8139/m.30145 type:complete len:347 (-) Transcript_8139:1196-2236(-)|eukprot:CAMPEP_0117441218 /NCGR_PEP_ID=MMETSP0759-20121206/3522_1 /TAXON_ID=63605 /ORGANISM="Percolomonas cosmopolitus, Strain WS" /LENGTH=346 /DNA_ID=CAMNT_0005233067 /DNA_START=231 /DNA_END=1271 /DNA_ORIENTATION=+
MKAAKISNSSLNNSISELEYDLEILEIKRELDQILESNERVKEKERLALENEYLVRKMLNSGKIPHNGDSYKLAEPNMSANPDSRNITSAIRPSAKTEASANTNSSVVSPHKIYKSNKITVRFQDNDGEQDHDRLFEREHPAKNGKETAYPVDQDPALTQQNDHQQVLGANTYEEEDDEDFKETQSEEILFQHEYESALSGDELKQLKEKREQEAAQKQRERNEAFMQQLQHLRKENETKSAQMIEDIRENEKRRQKTIQQQKKEIRDLSAENYQLKYQLKTSMEENKTLTQQNDDLVDQLLAHGDNLKKVEKLHRRNDELIQQKSELENRIRMLENSLNEKTEAS